MMTMKKIKCNWDLVSVHWRDAFDGENGWTDVKEYKAKEDRVYKYSNEPYIHIKDIKIIISIYYNISFLN